MFRQDNESHGVPMISSRNDKSPQHLMHLIVTRNGQVPNFSLLLGSGASSTSRVRTAQDMIEEWRVLLFRRSNSEDIYEKWIEKQIWYEHDDEYSILFESIYDQPSQRRIFVEECVKDSHPSWGYVYLTDFLANHFFDVVFTTNFDDLINEACYLYSDGLRPIVAAHDSAIHRIRVTSGRPKIIKLHGDFLYDNIKNTLAELETLETNTKRKLSQFAQEYGLIVLGYSGRDRSVMDTLELLLRNDENYKQGVYWCVKRGESISNRLLSLLRRDRVYLVEVDGFDEFMADLHRIAGLALPKPIARPLDMARDRAKLFTEVNESLKAHPVIGAHVKDVLGSINPDNPQIPLPIQATILSSMNNIDGAVRIWERAYAEDPENEFVATQYADALADAEKNDSLTEFVVKSPIDDANKTYFLLRAGSNQEVIDFATVALASSSSAGSNRQQERAVIRINRAIALKRLGRMDEMGSDLDYLERRGDTANPRVKAGVAALRGDKKAMFEALNETMHKSLYPSQLKEFPVFEDYQDDPEFIAFLESTTKNPGLVSEEVIFDESRPSDGSGT